LISQYR